MKTLHLLLAIGAAALSALTGAAQAPPLPPLPVARVSPILLFRPDGAAYVMSDDTSDGRFVDEYLPSGVSRRLQTPSLFSFGGRAHGVALLDGRLLACATYCHVYDPRTTLWEQKTLGGAAPAPLVMLDDGTVLRAGGELGGLPGAGAVIIDPVTLTSREAGRMSGARSTFVTLKLAGGRVIAAGGRGLSGLFMQTMLRNADLYDPVADTWRLTADMQQLSGVSLQGVALEDGRALVASATAAETYDPAANRWEVVPQLRARDGSRMIRLPNGDILIAGGTGTDAIATTLYSPDTQNVRAGRPLGQGRTRPALGMLSDGTVIAAGGYTGGTSVERITWEPRVRGPLEAGYYVATSTARSAHDGGVWGIDISAPGRMHGGLNFGGTVPAAGAGVAFAGFYLPEAQTVTGTINFQPLGSGNFQGIVRLLYATRQPVSPDIRGGTRIEFSQLLQPGFYVVEVQSGPGSPAASYQFAFSAAVLGGGAVAGGVIDPASGVPGFAGFYLAEPQNVTVRLLNEQSYGGPHGAREVILSLYDAAGRVVGRQGPGAMN